jgi:endonuclease III
MHSLDDVLKKLAWTAGTLAKLKRPWLESQKAHCADLKRDDFLWHYLLQSFATLGGVSGSHGLIHNKDNYRQMSYDVFNNILEEAERLRHASEIFSIAKVRYANKKAHYIVACFKKIHGMGGLLAAKEALLRKPDRDEKIGFLKSFPGVGDKYARNIMMDVYHEDFHDSVAVDSRIQTISEKWGLKFNSYAEHESFYLNVAHIADLNGWELDRLMFQFQRVFFPPIATVE